jgi:DNA polymerase (family 10)
MVTMTGRQIASVFSDIQTYLELNGEEDFKTKAYARAARALETTTVDVEAAARAGRLTSIPGIGKTLAVEVLEIVETGTCRQLEELRKSTPPGLIDITRIRGVGGKKVRTLHLALGVASLDELEAACRDNRVAGVAGFGAKSQENILAGIVELRKNEGRFRLDTALRLVDELLPRLRSLDAVGRAEATGRVRRGAEEFDHVSLLVETDDAERLRSELATILDDVRAVDGELRCIADGRFDVRSLTATSGDFIARLHASTGASDYAFMISLPLEARGYQLRDDALVRDGEPVALEREEDLFALAGTQFIAPELREGIDEVRRAIDGSLPQLVEASQMRGILHVHSQWSDGRRTIAELAEHAVASGYEYLLMCDHSKAAFYANGLDEARLAEQGREIDAINERYDPAVFRVLKGIECDILADGSLDLADDALAALDAVVVSVHSRFDLQRELQTERICRALEHRYTTILGHSTGRLILSRKGYDVDLRIVIDTAARYGRSIEINGNPYRLDLPWRMARHARRKGVQIAINPDAHSLEDFANVRYGLVMARKAALSAADIVNTMSADEFLNWAQEMRDRHA